MNFFDKKFVVHFEIKLWTILVLSFLSVLIGYFSWEYYWYLRVDYAFIKWHTHILVAGTILAFLFSPFAVWYGVKRTESSLRVLLIAGSICFSLFAVEVTLVVTGWNKVYMERTHGFYQSPYIFTPRNVYHTAKPNSSGTLETVEFSYPRSYNNLGYPASDWGEKVDKRVIRIVTLGDSFTEGDGAPIDSSYPALLETVLNHEGNLVEVLNAGNCGSDPVFSYKNLKDRIINYHPDIVLMTVSENDIDFDIPLRGGFERFASDSTLKFKEAPLWEPITAVSYLARLIMGFAGKDISKPVSPNDKNEVMRTNSLLKDLAVKCNDLGNEYNFDVVFVLLPDKNDMQRRNFQFDFAEFKKAADSLSRTQIINLIPLYFEYIEAQDKKYEDYYWVIDGHHNSKGYEMMAECIQKKLIKLYPSRFPSKRSVIDNN